ncbi:MAG: hypothetical protein F4232_05705 [Acidimicrobiaceae bacterium]|nr:hypothetical protein [Acidimicrobiaceae bacterium]
MAAVAGLAALAVVLVQNVVSDTSEQIEGSSARRIAAEVAAQTIVEDAKVFDGISYTVGAITGDEWSEWAREYSAKCNRLAITYADANLTVTAGFVVRGSPTALSNIGDAEFTGSGTSRSASQPSSANMAVAGCDIQ